jgi:hypothetical protein
MIAARYYDLIREMKHNITTIACAWWKNAKQRGIKPTTRLFATTVRKLLRRLEWQGPSGLLVQSRARHGQARKRSPTREAKVIELRKILPTFGVRRLIREFDLNLSHGATNASGANTD